ncbi:hypothetical protein Pmani_031354 [Petrolisthes manimaculis]|uniref:Ionotropic receptor 8a n=1 Tax=Petrolisthes manimaculis TaxID=1843537 RepID=A0AAE1NTZ8_9EUCA|nr:hypothetical protein Pmani_031354 [Petrolisthes manimaculis]
MPKSILSAVSVVDDGDGEGVRYLEEAVSEAQRSSGIILSQEVVKISLDMEEEEAKQQFCSVLFGGVAVVVDVTAGGWNYARLTSDAHGVPYLRLQISIYQWMAATDQLLQSRNATDAALIFGSETQLDQALFYLVEGSVVRVIVLAGIEDDTTATLTKMRPAPSYYVILGTTPQLTDLFLKAGSKGLVTRDSRWTLVATDHNTDLFQLQLLKDTTGVTVVVPNQDVCCGVRNIPLTSVCQCTNLEIPREVIRNGIQTVVKVLKSEGSNVNGVCDNPPSSSSSSSPLLSTQSFYSTLQSELRGWDGADWDEEKKQIVPRLKFDIKAVNNTSQGQQVIVGTWTTQGSLSLNPDYQQSPIRRYFKIGTIMAPPWVSLKPGVTHLNNGSPDDYDGYCVALAARLSQIMKFDYDFVFPADGQYGARQKNGSWNGLIADLANGVTDMILAPLTMTSEREEVIDFVAPYFDQSGISIVIRKRQREENLFKFMQVLRAEVWFSIVAALVVTGVMIWLLDKFSPYSAQNNATLYPPNCRRFTLKESFWFALTSFTPQGGGEAPKALSGRTLVAAYWLFVVLMLATFTANLAAFLTVERMQSQIQSLEALARQAKINFTTTSSTSVYEYFDNMAKAEEELFRVWKELTLNSTSDQSKYRVWDYPIKEQYTHILQVIQDSQPVQMASQGFHRVLENKKGEFAFIHDASEIRYQVYQDCLLTEVGEPFAEQPYAIAVQQGSHLQDEISRTILELQKDRYFEALTAQFWNASARGTCPNDSDSEGITLQSLGGVFIATLIGLALAMVALAAEVLYYKRGPSTTAIVTDINSISSKKKALKLSTEKGQVARINVTPVY